MKTAALYVYINMEEEVSHGCSINNQLESLRSHCQLYNISIYKEYSDRDVSVKCVENRYELQNMLRDAREGLFNIVLIWKINRLPNNIIDMRRIAQELNACNVGLESISEKVNTSTPMGLFAFSLLASACELSAKNDLSHSSLQQAIQRD